MQTNPQAATAQLYAQHGVPFSDAHFVLTVARPRGFSGPHDLAKLRAVSRRIKRSMDSKLNS